MGKGQAKFSRVARNTGGGGRQKIPSIIGRGVSKKRSRPGGDKQGVGSLLSTSYPKGEKTRPRVRPKSRPGGKKGI